MRIVLPFLTAQYRASFSDETTKTPQHKLFTLLTYYFQGLGFLILKILPLLLPTNNNKRNCNQNNINDNVHEEEEEEYIYA